jgi:hypothetical protein
MKQRVVEAAQGLAKAAHKALKIKSHSCVRMVVQNDIPYVVGVDQSPSFAHTGLFMRSAFLAGLSVHEIAHSVASDSRIPNA